MSRLIVDRGRTPTNPQSLDWRFADSARGRRPRLRLSRHDPRHEVLASHSTKSRGAPVLGFLLTNFFAKKVDKYQVTHSTCPLTGSYRGTLLCVAALEKMVQRRGNFLQPQISSASISRTRRCSALR